MEKSREGNGFQLILQQAPERVTDFFGRFLLGFVILLTAYGCIWTGLNLSGSVYTHLILMAVGTLYCLINCGLPKKRKAVYYISMILLAVYAVAVSRWIIDGWNMTANQVFAGLETHLGQIFPRYGLKVDSNMGQIAETLFLVLPMAILGLLAGWSARGKVTALLILNVIVLAASLRGLYTPDAWTVLLVLVTAAVCSRRVTYRNNCADHGSMTGWLLALLALLVAASLLPGLLTSDSTAQAEARYQAVAREIHCLRYEQNVQLMPEGDFLKLKNFKPKANKTVMTVTIPETISGLYLRGFVGERYTGQGWTGLPAAAKAARATDFSWLHNRGFYGQNQIAQLADVLNLETQVVPVTVKNDTACTGYRYAPYELKTGEPNANEIGDADIPATGLHGQQQYDYYVTNYSVMNYEELHTKLLEAWQAGNADAKAYLQSENVYRKYVYKNYMDVPKAAQQAVNTLMGGQKIPQGGLDFETAQQAVSAYLTNALTRSNTPPAYKGGDFLTFLADKSHSGYSVHYATAETLLFRSMGIPARYVEGYYITDKEAAAAREAGKPIEVKEADAHAWVEIYRDGVGFVPFEIDPSGASSMGQATQNNNNSGDPDKEKKPPKQQISIFWILIYLLIIVVALLIVAFLFLVSRRFWLQRRWQKRIERSSPGQIVELWTAYSVRLLGFLGIVYRTGSLYRLKDAITETLGQEKAEEFMAVVALQQQASFSLTPITDQQVDVARDFAGGLTQELKDRSKWYVRFKLRFWYCVF